MDRHEAQLKEECEKHKKELDYLNKLLAQEKEHYRNELTAEKEKHRREIKELQNWYLKTLKERDVKFLDDLKAAEHKYKIEVERHATVLADALAQAKQDRDQAALRLDSEK